MTNKIDEFLNILEDLLSRGAKVPLTGGRALVYANEGLEVINELRACLPDELKKADDILTREESIIESAKNKKELARALLFTDREIQNAAVFGFDLTVDSRSNVSSVSIICLSFV